MKLKLTVAAIAAVGLLAPSLALANPCKSQWQKLDDRFQALNGKIAKLLCDQFNKDDVESAQQCLADYEKAKEQAGDIKNKINEGEAEGSGKIGPRHMHASAVATGTLLAERTFIGTPVTTDEWKVDFRVTGGKAEKDWTLNVCLVDEAGNAKAHQDERFDGAKKDSWSYTFKNAYGLQPVIYLSKPVGLNGVKYRVEGKETGGEPEVIKNARKAAAVSKKKHDARPGR